MIPRYERIGWCLLGFVVYVWTMAGQLFPNVVEISTVQYAKVNNLGTFTAVRIDGFNEVGDPGSGDFIQVASCTDDGWGKCGHDAGGNPFQRVGFGEGGYIDAHTFGCWNDGSHDDTVCLQAALNAAPIDHIPEVRTGGYQSPIGPAGLSIPNFITLNLGANNPGKLTTTRDYRWSTGLLGALGLDTSGHIEYGQNSCVINGVIQRNTGLYPPTTFVGVNARDGLNIGANEAGLALNIDKPGGCAKNLTILGFNRAIYVGSQHVRLDGVFIDSRECTAYDAAEDDWHNRVVCKALLTQGLDLQSGVPYVAPSGDATNEYEFTFDVSAQVQFTFQTGDSFDLLTSPNGGVQSAAGIWPIINPVIRANGEKGCTRPQGCPGGTLQGSSANPTVLSASWSMNGCVPNAEGVYQINVTPNSTTALAVQQKVAATGISAGTTVSDIWPELGYIYVTSTSGCPFTQDGSGVNVTFSDDPFSFVNTGIVITGRRTGPGISCVHSSGIRSEGSTNFNHDVEWDLGEDCRNNRWVNCTSGTNDTSLEDGLTAVWVHGDHVGDDADSNYFVNCNLGQHVTEGWRNESDSTKPNYLISSVIAPGTGRLNGVAIKVMAGTLIVSSSNSGGGRANIFVADGTTYSGGFVPAKLIATSLTNKQSDWYIQTPLGDAAIGMNNDCSVSIICNHTKAIDVDGLTSGGLSVLTGANLLANSALDAWPDKTSYSPAQSTNTYLNNRWKVDRTGAANFTVSRATGFSGAESSGQKFSFLYGMRLQRTNGTSDTQPIRTGQQIFSTLASSLQGQSVTPSAYVKPCSGFTPPHMRMAVYTGTGIDELFDLSNNTFATGTASSGTNSLNVTPGTAARLVWPSVIIPSNATEIFVSLLTDNFSGTAGANDCIDVAGVKLEPGLGATIYAHPSFAQALFDTRVVFYKTFLYATAPAQSAGVGTGEFNFPAAKASGTIAGYFPYGQPMWTVPSLTPYNPAAANNACRNETTSSSGGSVSFSNISDKAALLSCSSAISSNAGDTYGVHVTVAAPF
jgi:hypothetical protein